MRFTNAHDAGKYAESLAQKSLWRRNYRVKDISHEGRDERADLLVNEKYKVEVKSMRGKSTTINLFPERFDVLCIVSLNELQDLVYFLKDKNSLKEMQSSDSVYKIDAEIIKKFFTKNPKNIFI